MGRGSSRSSSSGSRRTAPSYFGSSSSSSSAPSRSSHSSSSTQTRTATRENTQTHAPPPAVHHASPPAAPSASSVSSSSSSSPGYSGGLLSGLAGTVMQGMAFGGGSAIAHRAVDSIAGPRTVIHEHQGGPADQQAAKTTLAAIDTGNDRLNQQVEQQCGDEVLQFQKCLRDNNNSLNQCSFYFDVLSQCQASVKENAQWK